MKLKEIRQISLHIEEGTLVTSSPPTLRSLSQRVKQLVFKYLPKTLTPEMEFKTTLATLLMQKNVRDYLLDPKRREDFFSALKDAALECGYGGFSPPQSDDSLKISQELTSGEAGSLIDNPQELDLKSASLGQSKKLSILFSIFDKIERAPIYSVVEVEAQGVVQSIPLTTQYAQYKILEGKPGLGRIVYSHHANHATPCICTLNNTLPDAKGTVNQKVVTSTDTHAWIGSYCGELSTPFHVLEQILLICGETGGVAHVVERAPQEATLHELSILFSSLYSWYELASISDQKESIQVWNQKILVCGSTHYRLNLLYYNIPFNTSTHLPVPAEIKATMQDMNDEALISITAACFQYLNIEANSLFEIAEQVDASRAIPDFLEREKAILELIDRFRSLKSAVIEKIKLSSDPFSKALLALYDKKVTGINKLLNLDYAIHRIELFHNKNSQRGADRIAGAMAADKAQYAYQILNNKPFLPQVATEEEENLFKKLYTNYLLKEEPAINAALSSGFRKQVHHNPETRHYLI